MFTPTASRLPKEAYWRQENFDLEMAAIRTKGWTLVGLGRDVAKKNDYLTVDVGGKSVIIQNFGETTAAFDNVCAHRFARMRTEERGSGVLRCPYHSWTYGAGGQPVAIPFHDIALDLDAPADCDLRLRAWRLERCGDFLFVAEQDNSRNLCDDLGDLFETLAVISEAFGDEVGTVEVDYHANWKICIENSLDEYHTQFVHPTTFRQMVGRDFTFTYSNACSTVRVAVVDEELKRWRKIERFFATRPVRCEDYFNHLIFPTATVSSTYGSMFGLNRFLPIDATKTRIISRLFLTNFGEKGPPPANALSVITGSAPSFARTIIEEDRDVCERVQAGIRQAVGPGVISRYEQRIAHFQDQISRLTSTASQ